MHIRELKRRENYDANLADTIADAILAATELTRWNNAVKTSNVNGVDWFLHPVFGVYSTPNALTQVRRFLYQLNAFTPNRTRQWLQKTVFYALSNRNLYRMALKSAFHTTAVPHPEASFWLPGNHRFRYFDLREDVVYIFPKKNFSSDGIFREVEFRQRFQSHFSWLLPILQASKYAPVFCEKRLHAIPLNRIPGSTKALDLPLVHALGELHAIEAREITPSQYLALKDAQFEDALKNIRSRFPGLNFDNLNACIAIARKTIQKANAIRISMTHGDLQPGNVLVESLKKKETPRFFLIDWEDAAVRASIYDEMTFVFQTRSPSGLQKRLFEVNLFPAHPLLRHANGDFKIAKALWFYEEWIWLLQSSARDGITAIPQGLQIHFKLLSRILNMSPPPF